jgi:hypothetical protein
MLSTLTAAAPVIYAIGKKPIEECMFLNVIFFNDTNGLYDYT